MSCGSQCNRDTKYLTTISLPANISNNILGNVDGCVVPPVVTPPSRDRIVRFTSTVSGTNSIASNSGGVDRVSMRMVDNGSNVALQYEGFEFSLGNNSGYIEFDYVFNNGPSYDVTSVIRIRVNNSFFMSYVEMVNVGTGYKLRLYVSNNPNYRPMVGDRISVNAHCLTWIR